MKTSAHERQKLIQILGDRKCPHSQRLEELLYENDRPTNSNALGIGIQHNPNHDFSVIIHKNDEPGMYSLIIGF